MNSLAPHIRKKLESISFVVFDFDGVFTDNRVFVFEDGREAVACSRFDGLGLDLVRRLDIGMCIVSTETNPVVSARAKKLKIECHQGVENKKLKVQALLAAKKIEPTQLAYLGNDINDSEALEVAGLKVVVSDAWPAVMKAADVVLSRKGGEGAVREFCEMLYGAQKGRRL